MCVWRASPREPFVTPIGSARGRFWLLGCGVGSGDAVPPPPPPGGRCCEEASCTASVTLTLQQERRHSGQVGLAPGRALQPVAGTPREVECPRPPSGRGDTCYQAPRRACRAGPWVASTQPGSAQQPPPCVPPPHPTPGDSDTLTFAPSVLKLFPFNPRASQGPWL